MNWHLLDIAVALEKQNCDPLTGLSSVEAAVRLKRFGRNELRETGGSPAWRILWEQFTSTMALLLIGAALLSGFVGSYRDSAAILAIVCLFALLGFVQEYRAERAIRTLKRMAVPNVRVRRNASVVELPSADLVPLTPLLLAMVAAVLLFQGAVVYLPPLQSFFRTAALPLDTLAWVLLPGCAVFAVLELGKALRGQFFCRKTRFDN